VKEKLSSRFHHENTRRCVDRRLLE